MEKLIAFNKFDNEDAFLLDCNLVEKVKILESELF